VAVLPSTPDRRKTRVGPRILAPITASMPATWAGNRAIDGLRRRQATCLLTSCRAQRGNSGWRRGIRRVKAAEVIKAANGTTCALRYAHVPVQARGAVHLPPVAMSC